MSDPYTPTSAPPPPDPSLAHREQEQAHWQAAQESWAAEKRHRQLELGIRAVWLLLALIVVTRALFLLPFGGYSGRAPDSIAALDRIENKLDLLAQADHRRPPAPPVIPGAPDSETLPEAGYLLQRLATKPVPAAVGRTSLLDMLKPLEDAALAKPETSKTLVDTLLGDANEIAVAAIEEKLKKMIAGAEKKDTAPSGPQTQYQICVQSSPAIAAPPITGRPPKRRYHHHHKRLGSELTCH